MILSYLVIIILPLIIVLTLVLSKFKHRKEIKIIIRIIFFILLLTLCYYIFKLNYVIGTTTCGEWLTITTNDGTVYELGGNTGITITDKGHLLGTVKEPCSNANVMRVYSVKGDKNKKYLYTFNGYKGQIWTKMEQ